MESETRYHWRSLGWGPDNWDSGPNPKSKPALFCFLLQIDRCIPGESKEWSQLNAVERHSAEWLGYDEQLWKVRRPFLMLCV